MRIAVVAHLKHPIAEPFCGGLEMHTHLLERRLAAAGHEVTLFAADGSTGRDVVTVCAPTSQLEPDLVLALTVDDVEQGSYVGIVSRLWEGAFEIVHCNSLHPVPLLGAASLGVPTVCVLHTPPFAPYEAAARSCSGNVTFAAVSRSLARQWSGMDIDPLVIDNGIDLDRFTFRGMPDQDRFALWSGRIVPGERPPPRHRRSPRRRHRPAHRRPAQRSGLLAPGDTAPSRMGRDLCRPSRAPCAGRSPRIGERADLQSALGRAFRPRRSRIPRLRDPGSSVRPRRPAGHPGSQVRGARGV